MSYCTYLIDGIEIKGIPENDWGDLIAALKAVVNDEEGGTSRIAELKMELLEHQTPFTKARGWKGDEDVALSDIELKDIGTGEESQLFLAGTEYMGGSRWHVLNQINWVLAWLRSMYPEAVFDGRIEEWSGEEVGSPHWYIVDGDRAYAYYTKVVKGKRFGD